MSQYVARDYAAAIATLRQARTAGASVAPLSFFLGASLLETGAPEAAADAFADVIEQGESPYLAEARYYRAKSLLQRGDVNAAAAELRSIHGDSGAIAESAAALLTRIVERSRR
jgi:TolA-binding protein